MSTLDNAVAAMSFKNAHHGYESGGRSTERGSPGEKDHIQHINRTILYERKCFLASRLPTNFEKSL